MTFDEINIYRHIANTQNLSDTARVLGFTESALSKTIRRMESELGYPLFERTNNRLRLNENGKRAYIIFTNINDQWQELQSLHKKDKQTLRVFSTDIALLQNLSERIVYCDSENQFNIEESLSDCHRIVQAFDAGLCDISVTLSPIEPKRRHLSLKHEESLVIVCKKDQIKKEHPVCLKHLNLNRLLSIGKNGPLLLKVENYIKTNSLKIEISYQLDSAIFISKLANSNIPAVVTAPQRINLIEHNLI